MKRVLVFGVVMLILLAACGPSGVSQEEYDRVVSGLSAAEQQTADLASKLASAEQQLADLQSSLAVVQKERDQAAEASAMLQDWAAAMEALDAEKVASLYTDDCALEAVATGGRMQGKDSVDWLVRRFSALGHEYEITSAYGGSDWGAAQGVFTSTNSEGRRVPTQRAWIFELSDGRISRETVYWDASFLR